MANPSNESVATIKCAITKHTQKPGAKPDGAAKDVLTIELAEKAKPAVLTGAVYMPNRFLAARMATARGWWKKRG